MATFFTSDCHFNHQNIIKYSNRPYKTVEEMNADLVGKWNSVVGQSDEVYVLGDFSLAISPVEIFTNQLNGTKYLVPGNHDWVHSSHKKSRKNNGQDKTTWINKYTENGWIVLPEQMSIEIPTIGEVNLCHLPYAGKDPIEEEGDKYAKYRPIDEGKVLLCGHVHERWKTARTSKNTLMINVGVDVNDYKPISATEIQMLISRENNGQ